MSGFFIDKRGEDNDEDGVNSVCDWYKFEDHDEQPNSEEIDLPVLINPKKTKSNKTNHDNINLDDTYLITNYGTSNKKALSSSDMNKMLKNSSITSGMEQQHNIESIKSNRILKLERKKLRDKTKGKKWFDLPAPEITKEIRNDLQILKMRGVLDQKHVYKKNDITSMPKYFQVGVVVENKADFYSGRIVKSKRKKTLVDELLADAECKSYQKKKYKEIMDSNFRRRSGKKWKKVKN